MGHALFACAVLALWLAVFPLGAAQHDIMALYGWHRRPFSVRDVRRLRVALVGISLTDAATHRCGSEQ